MSVKTEKTLSVPKTGEDFFFGGHFVNSSYCPFSGVNYLPINSFLAVRSAKLR